MKQCKKTFGFNNTWRKAFSLIELLVVIVILGVLAALLLPLLTKAKARAQGVHCLSNLRQLQTGWQVYTGENHDSVAPNNDTYTAGRDIQHPSWVAGWLRTESDNGDKSDNTNTDLLVGPQYAQFGSIGIYVKEAKVYRCPADKSVAKIDGVPYPRVRSMSMNAYLWGTGKWQSPEFVIHKKLSGIANPASTWVFIDEREDSINDGAFGVDMTRQYAIIDYPASYHNGSCGVSFADGHSEYHLWRETTTTPVLHPGERLPRGSKFTSESDVDMAWLTTRTTVKK